MKRLLGLFVSLFLVLTTSCSSDLLSELNIENNHQKEFEARELFQFTYNGSKYETPYVVDSTGKLEFSDKDIETMFNKLLENDSVAIMVDGDFNISIFDSSEERDFAIENRNYFLTKNIGVYVQDMDIKLYDKEKGRKNGGRYLYFWSIREEGRRTPPADLYLPTLKYNQYTIPSPYQGQYAIDMDNAISSFEIWGVFREMPAPTVGNGACNITVTFYDEERWTGRSLAFTDILPGKTYSTRDYMRSFGFDNITSSMSIRYHR